jgi:hypothetical protein
MASERPVKSVATKENIIAVLQGALTRVKIGWCYFYDHRDKGAFDSFIKSGLKPYGRGTWIDFPGTESWSLRGAIGAAGAELKLLYIPGSYELLDKIDEALYVAGVMSRPSLETNPGSQEEVVCLVSAAIALLSAESHSQSAVASNESEKADERNQDSKEASCNDCQGLSQQGQQD